MKTIEVTFSIQMTFQQRIEVDETEYQDLLKYQDDDIPEVKFENGKAISVEAYDIIKGRIDWDEPMDMDDIENFTMEDCSAASQNPR